jgi:hypothetical protein
MIGAVDRETWGDRLLWIYAIVMAGVTVATIVSWIT